MGKMPASFKAHQFKKKGAAPAAPAKPMPSMPMPPGQPSMPAPQQPVTVKPHARNTRKSPVKGYTRAAPKHK